MPNRDVPEGGISGDKLYADHPRSITELRSDRSQDARDSGEVKCEALVMAYSADKAGGGFGYKSATPTRVVAAGLFSMGLLRSQGAKW